MFINEWQRWLKSTRQKARPISAKRAPKLGVETFEDRITPSATITDTNSGLTYATVNLAVAAANVGDVITVAGTDTENVVINKSITLEGSGSAASIQATSGNIITVTANNVVISGLTINGEDPASGSSGAKDGIDNGSGSVIGGLTVSYNTIENLDQNGITLESTSAGFNAGSISNNTFQGINSGVNPGGNDVLLVDGAVATVSNNTMYVGTEGVNLQTVLAGATGTYPITGNTIVLENANSTGIDINAVSSGASLAVTGNTITAVAGVTSPDDSVNTFTYGVYVTNVSSGTVTLNNTIGRTGGELTRGYSLWATGTNVSITGGTIGNSLVGVSLDGNNVDFGGQKSTAVTTVPITGLAITTVSGGVGFQATNSALTSSDAAGPTSEAGLVTLTLTSGDTATGPGTGASASESGSATSVILVQDGGTAANSIASVSGTGGTVEFSDITGASGTYKTVQAGSGLTISGVPGEAALTSATGSPNVEFSGAGAYNIQPATSGGPALTLLGLGSSTLSLNLTGRTDSPAAPTYPNGAYTGGGEANVTYSGFTSASSSVTGNTQFVYNTASPIQAGFTQVIPTNGSALASNSPTGTGFSKAPQAFTRSGSTVVTPAPSNLYDSAAWNTSPDTYYVPATAGQATQIRVYVGDPYASSGNSSLWSETITVNGVAEKITLTPTAKFQYYTFSVPAGPTQIAISITGAGGPQSVWVLNGLEVAYGANGVPAGDTYGGTLAPTVP